MENTVKNLASQALGLPASERIMLAEELLKSLDQPDCELDELDELWAKEAESRLDGFEKGEIRSVPLSEVFANNKKSL